MYLRTHIKIYIVNKVILCVPLSILIFYTEMHQGNCSKSGDIVKDCIIFCIMDNSQSSLY